MIAVALIVALCTCAFLAGRAVERVVRVEDTATPRLVCRAAGQRPRPWAIANPPYRSRCGRTVEAPR